jgi:hypothetical protein
MSAALRQIDVMGQEQSSGRPAGRFSSYANLRDDLRLERAFRSLSRRNI